MHLQIICILLVCIVHLCIPTCDRTSGCPDGKTLCEWLNWGGDCGREWSSCTSSCGGGVRSRYRGICCKSELASDWDACLANCGKDYKDSRQSGNCGDMCYNGGVIVPDISKTYARRCNCTSAFTGRCCSDSTVASNTEHSTWGVLSCFQPVVSEHMSTATTVVYDLRSLKTGLTVIEPGLCSWDNYYCWPGQCAYNNEALQCTCAPGFHRQTGSSETTCQLDSTNTPSIDKCDTKVTGPKSEMKQAAPTFSLTACSDLEDFYGNFQPRRLFYDLLTVFTVDVESYTKPDFIHDSEFGLTDVLVRIETANMTGTTSSVRNHSIFTGAGPSDVVRTRRANVNTSLGEHPPLLSDGEWLCVIYEAYGGGFLRSIDPTQVNRVPSAPVPYKKTKATRRLCYRYDISPPEHCKLDSNCTYEPLQVSEVVTRKPFLTVKFPGWVDPVPSGGNTSHASGIEFYQISVHEVVANKNLLEVDNRVVYTQIARTLLSALTLNLSSSTPKVYAIYLKTKDVAGNVRKTRRVVLFDNSSHIDVRPDKAFFVESALQQTNYTWQTNHNEICLNWTDHFYNRFYLDNPLLNPVEPDTSGLIDGVYEQQTGLLPVSGTPNVYGIVEFRTSWSLNPGTLSSELKVQDFQGQYYCNIFNVTDGQSYTFNIRAVDVAGNSYTENRTVHIDRSVPQIENIWLGNDDVHREFVQGWTNLSKMNLHFEAMDYHSGIREVDWTFGTSDFGSVLLTGRIVSNKTVKGCPLDGKRDLKCYCPEVGNCEFYQYALPMTNLATVGNHIGGLNRSYYFAIKAKNQALLSSTDQIHFIVNGSLSETEVIQNDSTNTAMIAGVAVGGVIGLAIVVLLTVIIVIMHKRRLEQALKRTNDTDRGRNSSTNIYDDISMYDLRGASDAYSSLDHLSRIARNKPNNGASTGNKNAKTCFSCLK